MVILYIYIKYTWISWVVCKIFPTLRIPVLKTHSFSEGPLWQVCGPSEENVEISIAI